MPEQHEFSSMLDVNLNDVPEMSAAEEGDHEIRIERYKRGVSRNGEPYVIFFFVIPSDPTSKTFSMYFGLGGPDNDEREVNQKLNRLRDMLDAFGVDYSQGVDLNAAVGATTWAILGVTNDDQYGVGNEVKKFLGNR